MNHPDTLLIPLETTEGHIDFTDAFDKLSAHLRHSCAQVGCSRLDEAEERGHEDQGDE